MRTAKRVVGLCLVAVLACAVVASGQEVRAAANPGAPVKGWVQTGAVGSGMAQGRGTASPTKMLLWNLANDRAILYGTVPLVYGVLDLTPEQRKSIEDLCKEAKAESSTLYKQNGQVGGADFYVQAQKKQDELLAKYQARILDVLTAEQKEFVAKAKALSAEKVEQDKKINEEMRTQSEKNQEMFEGKLNTLLSPAQKQKLEETVAAQRKAPMGREGLQSQTHDANVAPKAVAPVAK
jgi:hypothetical protein